MVQSEPPGIIVAITLYNDPLNLVAHKFGAWSVLQLMSLAYKADLTR